MFCSTGTTSYFVSTLCDRLSHPFSIIAVFEFQQFLTISAILHYTWTNGNSVSGMTWGLPRNCSTRCAPALHEAYLQWPVHRGPSHPYSFTSQLLRRPALAREGNSLRLLKVGAQPQAQLPLGLPHLQWLHLLKWRLKRRRSIRLPNAFLPVRPSEKKKKLVSESPNPEAERPFRDLDHTESVSEDSPHPL